MFGPDYLRSRRAWGARLTLLVALVLLLARPGPATPVLAQSNADSDPPALETLDSPLWAVALQPATLRSQPGDGGAAFATLRPNSPLQILGYAGDWAYVYNPRSRGTAYVRSDQLGPGDSPSSYVDKDPPPLDKQLDRTGRVGQATPVSYYPTDDPSASYTQLSAGSSVHITGSATGDDGQPWYQTDDGDFVPASAVEFPSAPAAPMVAAPQRTFAGHWVDVNLNLPARMVAYDGSTPVRSMYTIIGRGPLATPSGTFSIIRRVANETMDSSTVGIPRNSPSGYYLTNVLFTQYFLAGGQSIHYNYWSSNFGYPGSHGCLGLSYADAAYMWSFAGIGTRVAIHY
jgi:hypothetical protein